MANSAISSGFGVKDMIASSTKPKMENEGTRFAKMKRFILNALIHGV